jgi:two-component system response regulator GlrR
LDNKLKQLKILSVEDDNIIGEMLGLMLEDMGFKPVTAENAFEALEIYNEELDTDAPFDLVISDLGMEEMDGIALAKELKKITPDIPIILLTGFGSLVKHEDLVNVDCLLSKPVVIDELKSSIIKIMENRKRS